MPGSRAQTILPRAASRTPTMDTRIQAADEAALLQASRLLHADQLVAFPTETVYGLGGNALSTRAIDRIYAAKGRPRFNPLIVHIPEVAAASDLVADWPDAAALLAQRFWPGPLTLVLRRAPSVPDAVSAGRPTLALRVPRHPVALRLLAACGLPLAAPSANRSQGISPTRAEHVAASLRAADVPLILDGGPCQHGIESTVLDLTSSPPRLLRPGAIPLLLLREALAERGLAVATPPPVSDDAPLAINESDPASPGQQRRHYAPRTPLSLLPSFDEDALLALPAPRGLLGHLDVPALSAHCAVVERLPDDAPGYAADLYAALHRLDDVTPRLASIAVLPLPHGRAQTDDLWQAIRDRLLRAAAPPT